MHENSATANQGSHDCSCCSAGLQAAYAAFKRAGLSRRHLLLGAGTAAVGSWALAARAAAAQSTQPAGEPVFVPAQELVVQPVLTYAVPHRKEQTSWRPWGGLMSAADVSAEVARIETELKALVNASGLPLKMLPVIKIATAQEAAAAKQAAGDVMLVYASGGGRDVLEALISADRPTIVFLRHRSGPVSLWYEILHPHFMRKATDQYAKTGIDVQDVVVDQYEDLAWRLRALAALRKTLGQRIVALGGPMGWGAGHKLAPVIAKDKWHLDIKTVGYDELGRRIEELTKDEQALAAARRQTEDYLRQPNVSLHTDKKYVENAMLLCRVFKELMAAHQSRAFTIGHCMSTVMPMSQTTACLPLMLLNDQGYLAFCESDFVVIPAGILMHHIMGTPVFLNDPTWPHHGIVTLAHCTAPSRMNGKTAEPTKVYTHFESDYGAAPKVEMTKGQEVTMVVPDFECRKWVGAKGKIEGSPFHDICRAQIDVSIDGDWPRLVEDMRGFHWMMVYGDCRKEIGYAIKHLNIEWEDVSA